ncbi:hypothetical protein TNCV_2447461 [Trichonephila clavipes]|uniref:Mutator-like transposase domain-containing protein n=1 Tax=Trichonephila clavipes TaxID=2585209 RepID=A0A8X6SJV1_TRICX|nr:hypothetical protein TNCV_2447461 [Trichonephila clavipes]
MYGIDSVIKYECIEHAKKTVVSRLQKLKKSTKGCGGKSKLTEKFINTLQNYFGIAIRTRGQQNSSTETRVWKELTEEHRATQKTVSGRRKVTSACDDKHLVRMTMNARAVSSRQLAARWYTVTSVIMSATSIHQGLSSRVHYRTQYWPNTRSYADMYILSSKQPPHFAICSNLKIRDISPIEQVWDLVSQHLARDSSTYRFKRRDLGEHTNKMELFSTSRHSTSV